MFDVRSKSKAMRLRNGLCKTFTNRVIFGPDGCRENGSRQPSGPNITRFVNRSEEHTSELQSRLHIVFRLLLEKKKSLGLRLQRIPPPLACPAHLVLHSDGRQFFSAATHSPEHILSLSVAPL